MFCGKCGFEYEEGIAYCPQCGAELPRAEKTPEPEPRAENSAPEFVAVPESAGFGFASKVTELAKGPLFLTLTILVTASAGLPIVNGGFNIISLLLCIFMWIAYASAKKGMVDYSALRSISGVILAEKIIIIVVGAIFGLAGLAFMGVGNAASTFTEADFAERINEINIPGFDKLLELFGGGADDLLAALSGAVAVVFLVVAAVVILLAVFGHGSIHKLTKNTYEGVKNDYVDYSALKSGRAWIMVFTILGCIGGVGGDIAAVTIIDFGVRAATGIIAFILAGELKPKD